MMTDVSILLMIIAAALIVSSIFMGIYGGKKGVLIATAMLMLGTITFTAGCSARMDVNQNGQGQTAKTTVHAMDLSNGATGGEGVWAYTVKNDGKNEIQVKFKEASVYLPQNWNGKISVAQNDSGLSFYATADYEAYKQEGTEGGLLFQIGMTTKAKDIPIDNVRLIGSFDDNTYYITTPSDVQAYVKNGQPSAEYEQLYKGVNDTVLTMSSVNPK